MSAKRNPIGLALAAALSAAALAAPSPCAAQDVVAGASSGGATLDETKVIQGLYVSLAATESMAREDSPFLRWMSEVDVWGLASSAYTSYSLSFRSRGVSAQVSAWAQADASEDFQGAISQAWIKATFGEGWGLTFGRHELAWKDGGYWNPSDVVNDRLYWEQTGEAQGRDSIELIGLLPFMDFVLDINAATAFSADYADLEKLPLYLAAGTILYPFELRAKAAFQADRLPIVGGAVKLSLTGIDLYGDLVWIRDHPLADELGFGEDEGSWLRFCVGGSWAADISSSKLAKSLSLRIEYLRQGDGLSADQGSGLFDQLDAYDLADIVQGERYADDANAWDGRFFSLYRDYCVVALDLGEIANAHLGLSASGLVNLDDLSLALRGKLSWTPKNLMTISLGGTGYFGPSGSEAKALPKVFDCSLTLSKSF